MSPPCQRHRHATPPPRNATAMPRYRHATLPPRHAPPRPAIATITIYHPAPHRYNLVALFRLFGYFCYYPPLMPLKSVKTKKMTETNIKGFFFCSTVKTLYINSFE
jgi:hypothetical protein